jgi:hypothetical protein
MTANTVIINSAPSANLLQTINITSVADVVNNFDGTYTYGAYDFSSPEVAPATGDYVVLSDSGQNSLMQAAQYSTNYSAIGADTSQITSLTDNSGGTATSTLASIASGTPADLAAQAAINTAIRNGIASIAAKVNSLIAAG